MPANPLLAAAETFVTSAARTATGASTAFEVDDWDLVVGLVNVSAASGTSPTLVVYLQTTYDGGTTWTDVARLLDGSTTPVNTATAAGKWVVANSAPEGGAAQTPYQLCFPSTDGAYPVNTESPKSVGLGSQCRWKWVVGGTSPSFTFDIKGVLRRTH